MKKTTSSKICPECERTLRPGCCDGEPPFEIHIDPTKPFVAISYLDPMKLSLKKFHKPVNN